MKISLWLVAALVVLVGLGWVLRPTTETVSPPPTTAITAPKTVPPSPPPVAKFEYVVRHGQRVSGAETIRVNQGSTVTLVFTSDHADELHLHGYDRTLKLAAKVPAELTFVAEHSGRFEFELHHQHRSLGVLEVLPR